ncbi:MAG TPA: hypothetical protein VFR70_09400 [Flavobacterium sp.]|nr:hypothetical protein [Flavobacterium sp.]
MNKSHLILNYMDKLQEFFEMINSYIDMAIELSHKAKEWVERILEYIKKGVDYIVNYIGGRPEDENEQPEDDHIFV